MGLLVVNNNHNPNSSTMKSFTKLFGHNRTKFILIYVFTLIMNDIQSFLRISIKRKFKTESIFSQRSWKRLLPPTVGILLTWAADLLQRGTDFCEKIQFFSKEKRLYYGEMSDPGVRVRVRCGAVCGCGSRAGKILPARPSGIFFVG